MSATLEMTRPQAIETARRMHAGDWTIEEIRLYLDRRGHRLQLRDIRRWVDPEYDAAYKARDARRKRAAYRREHNVPPHLYRTHDDLVDLLLTLRVEDELSYAALIVIARRFFGVEFTDHTIRAELLRRGVSKNPNRVRAVREQNRKRAQA